MPVAEGSAVSTIDINNTGGPVTCSAASGDASTAAPHSSDGAGVTVSNIGSTTIIDSADTSDVTKGRGRKPRRRRIPATGAVLKLKAGGSKTLQRSYASCS